MHAEQAWQSVLGQLQMEMPRASFDTWVRDTHVVVYDEGGNFLEAIPGFHFAINEPAVAINPSKRMGWAFGPQFSQLQQFFY